MHQRDERVVGYGEWQRLLHRVLAHPVKLYLLPGDQRDPERLFGDVYGDKRLHMRWLGERRLWGRGLRGDATVANPQL
ncbi:MAG: hypothetical protein HYZ92_02975 [Candidatus Omnitrophica bacterium]|nr:hypothetical protein [Candidatus Omnitrophota bacterium]